MEVKGRRVNAPKDSGNNYTVRGSKQAAKLDLELKETPQSISVITQQQMQDQGLQDVQQIMEETPGVTVLQDSLTGMGDATYYSRGFEIQNYQVDGVMGNANILGGRQFVGMQDSFLYDRAEVVRGSTGLTTGTGDPAASVNFIRKRPLAESKGELNLKYGSWASRRVELDHNQVLNKSGTLRGRIVGTFSTGNSFLDRVKRNGHTYAASLEWQPTEKDTVTVGFSNQYRHTKGAPKRGVARHATVTKTIDSTIWKPASYWCENPIPGTDCEEYSYMRPTPDGGYIWGDSEQKTYHTVTMPRNFNNAAQWAYLQARTRNFFLDWQHRFNNHLNVNAAYSQTNSSLDHLYADIGSNGYFPQPEVDGATFDFGRNKERQRTQAFDLNFDGRFKLFGQDQQIIIGYNDIRSKTKIYAYDDYYSSDFGGGSFSLDCRPTLDYIDYSGENGPFDPVTGAINWVKGEDNKSYFYQCVPPSMFNNGDIPRTVNNPAWTLPISYGGRLVGESVNRHSYQRGPYFAMKLKPASWLTVIAGGRWAHYLAYKNGWSKTWAKGNQLKDYLLLDDVPNNSFPTIDNNGFRSSEGRLKKFVPYGGLIFQLNKNINAYASYTGILRDNDVVKLYPHNYRKGGGWMPPLEGNSKEFGLKGAFYKGRLNAAVSYFHMKQKNYPSLEPTGLRCDKWLPNGECGDDRGGDVEFSPVGGYTSKGWDINLAGQLTPKWRISAGYVNQKMIQPFPDKMSYNDRGDNLNLDFQGTYTAPRHSFKLFTSYDFTPKFTAGIGVRWSSRIKPKPFVTGPDGYVLDKSAVYHQPSFAVWHAMARWNFRKNASLGVSVNNLFDKKYWSNDRGNFYGAPRNATVNLKMKW
ncbi:TonB-dependent siderophore receptor [Neisseria sp.]|uniref:TonB-dependent siderophore receptor n=1 Tax=Neisseria sp. TaxID=192066 RepID=UPI00359F1CB3